MADMMAAIRFRLVLPVVVDELFTEFPEDQQDQMDIIPILAQLGVLRREFVPRIALFAEINVFNFAEWDFWFHFRLFRSTFEILYGKIRLYLEPDIPRGKRCIPPTKQVLIFLWYMANTGIIREISLLYGIIKSTVHSVLRRVAIAIDSLKIHLIVWPTGEIRNRVSNGMAEKLHVEGCVGCLDGTHIRLAVIPNGDVDYINRKGYPSFVLQVVADDRMLITDSYVAWPGSTHDARVWRNSPLSQHLRYMIDNNDFIIGDSAYPLSQKVVTPFRDNGVLTPEQRNFNKRISSCRQIVERAIGLLKCRFRRLKNVHCRTMEDACFFVASACVLHNLCILSDEDTSIFLRDDVIQNNDPNRYPPLYLNNNAGIQRRNALVQQLWQLH